MANHITDLLNIWEHSKSTQNWVLATIIETEGSSYRKAGAMMFINDLGQYFGLLSGGCLEADIMRQARKCWDTGNNRTIEYDMREEEDLAWQLGLGCGGRVKILLQPIAQDNQFLSLGEMKSALEEGRSVQYSQEISETTPKNHLVSSVEAESVGCFVSEHKPQIRLGVFGGGVDARPLVAMAHNLGWQVYLVDHRTGYAREQYFPGCKAIIKNNLEDLADEAWLQKLDAAVILNHNVDMDGQSLALLQHSSAKYIGMLGPTHRTERVYESVGMTKNDLRKPLFNPIGLDLGGELPESIALSILSEIHGILHQSSMSSLNESISQK